MRRRFLFALAAGLATAGVGPAAAQQPPPPPRAPDLGDLVQGNYSGTLTSASTGASQAGVFLTVMRSGPDRVRVTSDDPRLQAVEVRLARGNERVVQAGGDTLFIFDPQVRPARLEVGFANQVSWIGRRQ